MCGICGAIQVRGESRSVLSQDVLDRMTDVMVHRGPDDRGTHLAPRIALGVRRLSIVDVDGGHQPLANESGDIWAVQNGELYNHASLRVSLDKRGHTFRSRCDTEVIPHLYEEYGTHFPEHLRGMFGIALWDERRRKAVLARDRLGIKPLYYALRGDVLLFASELKSILASGLVEPDLDAEAIDAYLGLGFFPGPLTPLAGVSKLLPGHALIIDAERVRAEQYWEYPKPAPLSPRLGVGEYAERLLAELEESVRLRLMSDVPLGAMLSGGLDSSLVVAIMARLRTEPVTTFSVGFVEAGDQNELDDARFVASCLGTDHHELELSFTEDTVDLVDLVWHLDEPLNDLSALGFHALSKLAADHVRVALSGQGADELLGGYRRYRNAALLAHWNRLPSPLRSVGLLAAGRGPRRLRRAAKTLAAADTGARFLSMRNGLDAELRQAMARGALARVDQGAAQRALTARAEAISDPLEATLYLDAQLGLVDDMLHYFDRASMAHSLEVRVPFLDHHLVEYCATIPADLKVRRLTTKYLLKRAARGLIPDRIIEKPKVGFFNGSVESWIARQMNGLVREYLFAPSPRFAELLDASAVRRLVEAQVERPTADNAHLVLSILMLEVWLSTYLPRALGAPKASRLSVAVGP